jgi:hypothetical protein
MKKTKFIAFIASLAFFSSCNSGVFEEHEIGENLIDKSTEVLLIDTFTIQTSTVKLDSVNTSGFKNVLVGKYQDPYFGKVSSDFYASVDLGQAWNLATSGTNKIKVKFDSLVFIGYFDEDLSHFIGDSLVEQKLSIHRIIEKIELPDNKFSFKAHDVLDFDSESLGETVFVPKPRTYSFYNEENDKNPLAKRGGVRFRMKDKLGLDIVNLVNRASDTILLPNEWTDYFKGIVIKAGLDNSSMFSFQTGSNRMKIRLYYSNIAYDEVGVVKFRDFSVNNALLNFLNNKSDYISENEIAQKIGNIVNVEEELSAVETEDLSFIQGSLGLMTKVKIQNIENLNILGMSGGILKAELRFYPKEGSYDSEVLRLPDPSTIFIAYHTEEDNKTVNPIINPTNGNPLTAVFVRNQVNIGESYYSINLTDYVNNILLSPEDYDFDNAIILSIPTSNQGNSMERLVIDNNNKSDMRMKLEVTYVVQN